MSQYQMTPLNFQYQPRRRQVSLISTYIVQCVHGLYVISYDQVIEVEAEPQHTALDDSRRELVLSVQATVDHVQYTCPSQEIRFTDTLLYQTRVYKLPLTNAGQIPLSYNWSIVHSDGSPLTPHSSQLDLDEVTGSVTGEGGEVAPFSISPSSGQILPGKDAVFSVSFSPLDVKEWECKLVCRYTHT